MHVNCPFCKGKEKPDYKDYKKLAGFLSDRSKIIGRKRSGVCSRHQRALTYSIKRAQYLGLPSYSPKAE